MSETPDTTSRERLVADRYRLLSALGEGGMGTVWRARDEVLQREVAVKEVRAPSWLPEVEVQRLYVRLEREAWAAARISHRGVVTVYDVANDGGRPWIVMELVRGLSLADALDAEGPMPPQRAALIGAEVLAALGAAHEAGVLHRDVKPGNVLLASDGRVVLTDFGIAVVEGSSALTLTGEVIGSPEFLAPERALGRTPGPESDLWSLGVLLYAAVEGHTPFRQNTPLSTLRAVVDDELPPPRRAGPLAPVIEGLLRKDPAERPSAAEVEHDLRRVGTGGTPAGPPDPTDLSHRPTVAAHHSPAPPPPPSRETPDSASAATGGTGNTGGTGSTGGTATEPRRRRTIAALAAGLVALLLAAGGLTYALMNPGSSDAAGSAGGGDRSGASSGGGDSSGGGGTGGGGTGGGSGGTEGSGSGSGTGDDGGSSGGREGEGGQRGGGDKSTEPAAYTVHVSLRAVRWNYTGTCPAPEAQAPSFTATFTVNRVPVAVEYRFVTGTGQSSDPGWKTLDFAAGGPKSRWVNHVETAYDPGGESHNTLYVEVRRPVAAKSDTVAYAVTCEQETPSDGGSYPQYGSDQVGGGAYTAPLNTGR